MNRFTILFVLGLASAVAQTTEPAPSNPSPNAPAPAATRPELMQTFRQDLETARANATLSAQQLTDLDTALATLREVGTARHTGKRPDREKVKSAMTTIGTILRSDAFKADDKAKIQATLQQLRDAAPAKPGRFGKKRGV